jgi:hypothetical protein
MKKLIILMVLAVMLAGCQGVFEKDETGTSPALETVGKLRDANVASVPVNPYAHWIEIGLGIVTVVLGGSYVKQNKELKIKTKKYTAHKVAGERIMRSPEPVSSAEIYNIIGEERNNVGL